MDAASLALPLLAASLLAVAKPALRHRIALAPELQRAKIERRAAAEDEVAGVVRAPGRRNRHAMVAAGPAADAEPRARRPSEVSAGIGGRPLAA